MRRVAVFAVFCVVAAASSACDQSKTKVKLYKGPVPDPDRYLASTFSPITCDELARGLCKRFGKIDREYLCADGDDRKRVQCELPDDDEDDAKTEKAAKQQAPPKLFPPAYYAEVMASEGQKIEHAIAGGRPRTITVTALGSDVKLRCTWTAGMGINNMKPLRTETGSSCKLSTDGAAVVTFLEVVRYGGGSHTVVAD